MIESENDIVAMAAEGHRPNSTGWIRINCPLCVYKNHDNTPDSGRSLGVHHETGWYRCFRCESKGRTHGGLSDDLYEPAELPEISHLPAEMKPLFAQLNAADAEPALRYMTQRGYSKIHIAQAMTHYATEGYFHDRVIFPHYYKERLWGWTARDYTGRSPSPKLFPAGMTRELLYNQEVLELETKVPCFVVESVTSSIRLLPHVCATLGQPTDTHFETLAKVRSRPLIITLDGDRWRNCRRMARELRDSGCNAKAILLPPGEDPDTVSAAKLAEAREYLLTNPDKELDLVQKDMVEVDYDY